jgi:hypothetical protein
MKLVTFLMLICITSLTIHRTIDVTVHNQCPNIELISPVYFYNCGAHYEHPVERIYYSAILKTTFSLDLDQDEPGGILMYKMQRKRNTWSNYRSSIDLICAEDISEMMRLLVIWKIRRSEEPKVNIVLVENGDELVLNEDELAQLYDKVDNIFFNYYSRRWLTCNNKVLETTYRVVHEEGLELRITISQGVKYWNAIKSMWINSKRQVLLVIMA